VKDLKTWEFKDSYKIKIVNLGDVHFGNPFCDWTGFFKIVDYIQRHPDVYWVSTGDILEVNTKNNKTFDHDGMSLQEELTEVCDALKPIAEKCLGIVGSNHHYRVQRQIGLSLDALLAELLGIPFLGFSGFLRIVVGNIGYFIAMHHSMGFGKSRGAKVNNLQRLGDIYKGYDLYLTGHTHCYTTFIDSNIILDRKHYCNMEVKARYVTTGHYLDYEGSYAEMGMLTPAPKGSAEITLHAKNKNITVDFLEV